MLRRLKQELAAADAVVIGAGAGMSAAAGFSYDGERFTKYFRDFQEKYGIQNMYAGGFYPFKTLEEYWAWWSRHIYVNRYAVPAGKPYIDLRNLLKDKNYFVLTTNVDHQFQKAGFDKQKLFYPQGDYGLWQCANACHEKTYDNEEIVYKMICRQENMKVPKEFIPYCPVCGAPMTMNLRCDDTFVQDAGWYAAQDRCQAFLHSHQNCRVLYLELGVGNNTPAIIKYPFWQLTFQNPHAVYACINSKDSFCPRELLKQSICIPADIRTVFAQLP